MEYGTTYEERAQIAEVKVRLLTDEIERLRADAERFIWLANRLQDISIDLAEPASFIDDSDDWPNAWRKAIDAARSECREEDV